MLDRALTHRSFAYENGGLPTNERLEFLGDSVLGVVVTDTLFRAHPDLSEGRLAKLRAAVVNARALAEVARTIDLGRHIKLGRGEESTGGRNKSSILSDTVEAVIGAVYLSGGFEAASEVVHLLFDPLMENAARLGAGLDWKTSLQELSAEHSLGVPEYVIEDDGPRPREDLHRPGPGRRQPLRPRHRPVQEGGRAAGRRDGLPSPSPPRTATPTAVDRLERRAARARAPRGRGRPPRPRGPRRRPHDRRASRSCTRAPCAGTSPAPRTSPRLTDRPGGAGRRAPREVPLAARSTAATRVLGHLGMSGQMLVQPAGAPDERHLRVRFALRPRRRRRRAALRRPADVRRPRRSPPDGADLPPEIAHIARDPIDPLFDDDAFVAAVRRRSLRHQAHPARPDRRVRGRQHLRRRGAVARAAARRPARRQAPPRGRAARCSPRSAQVMAAALDQGGTSFDALYVNVNGRERLLRPVAARLRAGGAALRPVRDPDRAGVLHEPFVVLLPGLSAAAARPAAPPEPAPGTVPVQSTGVHGSVTTHSLPHAGAGEQRLAVEAAPRSRPSCTADGSRRSREGGSQRSGYGAGTRIDRCRPDAWDS